MTSDPAPGEGRVSGNTFHGPAPFQVGDNNVQNIHLHGPGAPKPRHRPLVLAGAAHTTRQELASAIRRNWDAARRQFFEGADARSEGWLGLLAWLRALDDLSPADLGALVELIDHRLRNDALPADVKLLHLLCWLDPEGEATYRGDRVTVPGLIDACLGERETPLAQDLFRYPLLDALSRFRELHALSGVQDAWDDRCRWWEGLGYRVPVKTNAARLLLLSVLDDPRASERLRKRAKAFPVPDEPVEWYEKLLDRVGGADTPLAQVVRIMYAKSAADDVLWERERRQAERELRERERTQWERRCALDAYQTRRTTPEAQRLAVLRAAAWHGMWGVFTAIGYWLAWGKDGVFPATRAMYFQIAVLTLAALVNRIPQVRQLGSAYRPPVLHVLKWLPTTFAGLRRALGKLVLLGSFLFVQDLLAELVIIPFHEKPNVTHTGATLASIPFFLLFIAGPALVLINGYGARTWDEEHQRWMQRFRQSSE
ncbi:hypothetical protein SAMN05216188_1379 [Lentzea xinjiangensis]|uniref:Uncharacterized protein n=1 Tax=Lentzea xinjiangensis TaxID=402600 RepID=A0A1H9WMH0_9PSEU|nr:hypothetical protein [Lentzea xinjiangensis]SES34969.1 hypothetical protein SAMN05216188_1379 [Lentzea xinjiangensis]